MSAIQKRTFSAKTREDLQIQVDNFEDLLKPGQIISISPLEYINSGWYFITIEFVGNYR